MIGRIAYSAAQPGSFAQVPESYLLVLMRQVDDPVELKVTMLVFHLLSRSRSYPGVVMYADLVMRAASVLGIDEIECGRAIDAAVNRGVFLKIDVSSDDNEVRAAYVANLEADLDAIERLKAGSTELGDSRGAVPNVFELYEQNIGIITPMIAEELRDAQRTYPAEWIEEAFREAVRGRKQNWKYISRILERWTAEGKGSGAHRPGALPDDPDKYVKGRYGRIVRR